MKFKVGDRVRVIPGAFSTYFKPGNTGTVVWTDDDYSVRVQFDMPYHSGLGLWLVAECSLEPLLPAIPPGWTPASEPPSDECPITRQRNVRVLTNDGVFLGWYGGLPSIGWIVYDAHMINHHAASGEVLAWREIEPAAKRDPRVRYAAVVGDEIARWYNTFDEAAASAVLHAARTNEQTQVVKVVAEVKPGKPEVIRMEE